MYGICTEGTVATPAHILTPMPTFKDVVMVPDKPVDRTVDATIICPPGVSCVTVQELAEKAWRSPAKSVTTEDGVTVKVRAFKR